MRQRGTPVSREALYGDSWTNPVIIVAPRDGLSDVELVEACKKLSISVPARGPHGTRQHAPRLWANTARRDR